MTPNSTITKVFHVKIAIFLKEYGLLIHGIADIANKHLQVPCKLMGQKLHILIGAQEEINEPNHYLGLCSDYRINDGTFCGAHGLTKSMSISVPIVNALD